MTTSVTVDLIVETAPVITNQPVDQVVMVGGTAVISVGAIGNNLNFQWYESS